MAVEFTSKAGVVHAVEGISFEVDRGEAMGLAGESGCGKTTTALALMRLLPYNGRIVRGSIRFGGRDLVPYSEESMRPVRWKEGHRSRIRLARAKSPRRRETRFVRCPQGTADWS